MKEGAIVDWLKGEGDEVEHGEPILEISSDKSVVEYESRASGFLLKILAAKGDVVPVGKPLCVVGKPGEDYSDLLAERDLPVPNSTEAEQTADEPAPAISATFTTPAASVGGGRILASPAARKYARDHGIELAVVYGAGPGGRILEKDVIAAAAKATSPPMDKSPTAGKTVGTALELRREPLSDMRRAITAQMTESKQTIPHFYLTSEVDCTGLKALRGSLAAAVELRCGARLGYNDLIFKAVAAALERHLEINASFGHGEILYHGQINLGLAVGIPGGLIVPVLRGVNRLSLSEVSLGLAELVKKARNRRLFPEEYSGGTFTVSNLGMYHITSFQAIINPPESAILALGAMTDRAVVLDGQLAIRPMMSITLSCDHRVINGADGAKFLDTLGGLLERPEQILC